jgi:coenzyme F420-reducing hydrogenase delta subunit
VSTLTGTADVNRNQWTATVVIRVADGSGATVSGAVVSGTFTPGAAGTCTTGAAGTCTIASGNLNAKKVASTTFVVTGVEHGADAYLPGVTSVTIDRP